MGPTGTVTAGPGRSPGLAHAPGGVRAEVQAPGPVQMRGPRPDRDAIRPRLRDRSRRELRLVLAGLSGLPHLGAEEAPQVALLADLLDVVGVEVVGHCCTSRST